MRAVNDRVSGGALIAGALLSLVTMALHPTGGEILADFATQAPRNILAHALALCAVPLTFFGALGLAGRLSGAPALARFGLVSLGVASVAVMNAAIASGLFAPMLIARILDLGEDASAVVRELLRFNGMVNHGFAAVYVVAAAVAVLAWSVAMLRVHAAPHGFSRGLGVLGALVGATLLVITGLGRLRLDVHHFGMVVIAIAAWQVWAGVTLLRTTPGEPPPDAA